MRRPRATTADLPQEERHAVQDEPGTIIERRVSFWLRRHGWQYEIQVPFAGGRGWRGGMVIDHYLPTAFPQPKALFSQGAYWHPGEDVDIPTSMRSEQDQAQNLWLMARGIEVVRIPEAVIMDDYRLNQFMQERVGLP